MCETTLKNLLKSLVETQDLVIGVYKPELSKVLEPIVDIGDNTIVTVTVGSLLGLHTNYHPIMDDTDDQIDLFPEGKNLTEMTKDPHALYAWQKEVSQKYIFQ